MANLIITVIAIALVAVASLMGAYYGGSAFLNNQAAAGASTLENQGQQLAGAWQAYLGDNLNVPPAAFTALKTNNYLAAIPTPPVVQGYTTPQTWSAVASGTNYYAITSAGKAGAANSSACSRLIHSATGASTTATPPTEATLAALVADATAGNGTYGCGIVTAAVAGGLGTAGTTAGDYVMFYKMQ